MKRKSKSELVLDIYDREAMGEVTAREVAIINQALIEEFGEGGAMDPGEIARVLVDEDIPVRYEQIFRMAALTDKYETTFSYLPGTDSLTDAEATLREIDRLYRVYQRQHDRTGLRYARQAAQAAKGDAEQAAQDAALDEQSQAEQAEIAQWFRVWLQTPDLFEQWLALRQGTNDYRNKFLKTKMGI